MNRPRVVVAVPSTGHVHQATDESIRKMMRATIAADAVAFWWDNDQPHDRCRNALIARFMKHPEWTHLLFVDTDVALDPDTLDRLLAHDAPIVCAPVPTLIRRYGPPDEPQGATVSTNIMLFDDPSLRGGIVEPESPNNGYRRVDPDNFPSETSFTCDATGLGLVLIHRDVFERLERPWCAFVGQFDSEKVGEDIYFFRKARAAGFEILVDPTIPCDHFKPIDLTHLDLLYTDRLPVSSWPRLTTENESRSVLIAVRVPRTGWLNIRLMETLDAWQQRFGERIRIEKLYADTVRGGFVELAERVRSVEARFTHVLVLGEDVVPFPATIGLLGSVDAPIVGGLTRSLIDGKICWSYWTSDPLSGGPAAPQNIRLPELTEPFEVDAIDPACMLIRRETLDCVPGVLRLLDHGPETDRAFVHGWCRAVTVATGRKPVQTPMTVERRVEVGLAGMLGIKLRLKQKLRDQQPSTPTFNFADNAV